jgi:hypothetical protein
MPKNIEDIVVPEKRKSIRDIPIPRKRAENILHTETTSDMPAPDTIAPIYPPPPPRNNLTPPRRRSFPKKAVIILLVLILLLTGLGVFASFSRATLVYTPKVQSINFDADLFSAERNGNGGLTYNIMKISRDMGEEVVASGQEEVNEKASGTIVVYNNNSTAQNLIKETRFETSDAKIYKVAKDITIPARTIVDGESRPGMLEVTVYADKPGESYNIGLVDFTVPGLKGTARYESIYARSKTVMTGGFVGTRKNVSESELTSAKLRLKESINSRILEEAKNQIEADFIMIPSFSTLTFEDLAQSVAGEGRVTVNMRGNFNVVVFKRNELSTYLGAEKVQFVSGDSVGIDSLDSLTYILDNNISTDLLDSDKISFKVTGQALLVWRIDESALKKELAGKRKNEVGSIISNYPSISKAEVILKPFWKSSLPDDPLEIIVKKQPVK